MQHSLYFWHGALNAEQFPECKLAIAKLLAGFYREVDLKKMRSHRLFRIWITNAGRLIFTTVDVEINGVKRKSILFLEFIPDHKYHRCKFLNPQVLEKYRDDAAITYSNNDDDNPEEFVDHNDFEIHDETPCEFTFTPMTYFKNHIVLDVQQTEALSFKTPLIICGAAGTGKTCLSLELFAQHVREYQDDAEITLHYVTELERLKSEVEKIWLSYPEAHQNPKVKVIFTTFEELAVKLDPSLKNKTRIAKQEFQEWCIGYNKKNKKSTFQIKDFGKLYQEFRIISALTVEEYKALGESQTLFPNDQRGKIFEIYQNYQNFLGDHYFDPAFLCLQPDISEFIVADESLDLSWLNLLCLAKAAKNMNIVFLADPHQSLKDQNTALPFLQNLSLPNKRRPNFVQLSTAYRSPAKVIALANLVFAIRNVVSGGANHKGELQQISSAYGNNEDNSVLWFDHFDAASEEILKQYGASTNFAIITLPEFVDEAIELYGTELVSTLDQFKGLERKIIVLHRIFEDKRLIEASKLLNQNTELKIKEHCPKNGKHCFEFSPAFNLLSTAMTRVRTTLIIYQPPCSHNRQLIEILKPKDQLQPKLDPVALAPASDEQWEMEAKRQDEDIAKKIRSRHKRKATKKVEVIALEKTEENNNLSGIELTKKSLLVLLEDKNHDQLKELLKQLYVSAMKMEKDKLRLDAHNVCQMLLEPLKVQEKIVYLLPLICKFEVGILFFFWALKNANLNLLKKHLSLHINFLGNDETQTTSIFEAISCKEHYIANLCDFLKQHQWIYSKLNPKLLQLTYNNYENLSRFVLSQHSNAFLTELCFKHHRFALESGLHEGIFMQPTPDAIPLFYQIILRHPGPEMMNSGISLLTVLQAIKPTSAMNIDFDKFMELQTRINNYNYRPIEILTRSDNGIMLFIQYYKCNDLLRRQLTGRQLLRDLGDPPGNPKQVLLIEFCVTPAGNQFLLEHSDNGSALLQGITHRDLLEHRTFNDGGTTVHYSMWLGLSTTTNRLKLLHKILLLNPEIIQKLTYKDLCEPFKNSIQFKNVSSIFFMFNDYEGIEILKTLLSIRPEIAMFFSVDEFSQCVSQISNPGLGNGVFALTYFKDAIKLLQKHNPKLAEKSFKEIYAESQARLLEKNNPKPTVVEACGPIMSV